MTRTPLQKAKILLPDIPSGALHTDRIKSLAIEKARAAIISAPAGYGKTTAVLLSLQQFRASTHWYRLEKEDAVLSVFFTHLIETLFGSAEANTASHRSLDSIGNITEEYSLLSAVICHDAWSLYAYSDTPRYLVFDDFQNIADNAAISETLRYLISNMPRNMHVIIISRVETYIRTKKLELSDELVRITGEDLLFTQEEIKSLFSGFEEGENRETQADEIFGQTQGWIAGVTLLKQMPGHRGITNIKGFQDDKESIFKYLADEVFAGIDRSMMLQAAMISLPEEFSCEDLSGIFHFEYPEKIIDWLERNNLYIYRLNTDPVCYRFHTLFRDALYRILTREFTKDEISVFHHNAAVWFERSGRYRAAIDHYLSGNDKKNAVRIVAEIGQSYMDSGDVDLAGSLIRSLPERLIFDDATLLMILGCVLSGTEVERGYSYLLKAIEMAVSDKNYILAVKTQGFAISVCLRQNDFQNIENVISTVPMIKAIMSSKQAWKMLLHSLFLKTSTSLMVRPAKILCRIVDKIKPGEQEELWKFSSLLSKAYFYGVIGELSDAERIARELATHQVALRNDRWNAFGLQLRGYLHIFTGEKNNLLQAAGDLTSHGLKYSDRFLNAYGVLYTAIAKYQGRDLTGAVQASVKAEKLFLESNDVPMAIFCAMQQTFWQSEPDTGGSYADLAEAQLEAFKTAGGRDSFIVMAQILTAALFINEGNYGKAKNLLEQAWKWAKSKQAQQTLCAAAMQLAVLNHKMGDKSAEEKYLRFFGDTAGKKGYLYFREMRYDSLVRTCARCAEKGIAPQYMASLVGRYFGYDAAAVFLKDPAAVSADPHDFMQRFKMIAEQQTGKIQIKLFGSFGLTIGGKQIDPEVFKTRKISAIFRHILAGPGQTFSHEKLAADFWPDSTGKAASNSLRAALFELRNALAALNMAFDGDNALIAEDAGGFYLCRPEIVDSDAARFAALYDRLRAGNLTEEEEKTMLRELTDVYDGDYLEGSASNDLITKRAYYKTIFSEAARRLSDIYTGEGLVDLARELILKQLKMTTGALTHEEIKVANLLLGGVSLRDVSRKLNISAAEVRQYETSIRHKLNLMGDHDPKIASAISKYDLTKRETDMLKYLRDGTSTEDIAAELYISAETVRVHISRLLKKLGMNSRQDVALWLNKVSIELPL